VPPGVSRLASWRAWRRPGFPKAGLLAEREGFNATQRNRVFVPKKTKNMKTIINKKVYDTEKATEIAFTTNGYDSGDFNYQYETLYVTENGAWFLHGEGGALSDYAQIRGRERTGGEKIRPLSRDEAYAWLEENRKVEAIETYFLEQIANA
jgi:hypothetical protein